MRKSFAAFVFATLALAQPAAAITFPLLTTIYVITGVKDSGGANDTGHATVVQCSNVSGATTTIRFLTLSNSGTVIGNVTRNSVAHGATIEHGTKLTLAYDLEFQPPLLPGNTVLSAGVLNIESLESGVFCSAAIIDASLENPVGVTPHIIRVNPHPGVVE